MKWLIVTTLLGFMVSFVRAEDLHSFCKELDTTLRGFNQTKTRSCKLTADYHIQTTTFATHKVTVLSEADAQKLFSEMQSHTEIPFDFVLAGCAERAHEMSRLMLLKGITPLKAFAYVENGPVLEVPHPKKKNEKIQWVDHVAPVVMVEKEGKIIPYVIDPSIQKQAVPSSEWFATMTKDSAKSQAKLKYGTATTLLRYGTQVDFKNEETNRDNSNELKRLKQLSLDPDGENKWKEEDERVRWKIEPPGY